MYLVVFGIGLTAALPLAFAVIVGSAFIASHITRDHRIAVYVQIVCIIYIPTFIQWSTGGAFDAGFVMAWAFLGPLIALMFFSVPRAAIWQGLFLVNVVITVAFNDTFASNAQAVSDGERLFFLAMNLGMASVVVFVFAAYFVRNALNEKKKADNLLRNILPDKIARTLKSRDGVIAEEFGNASVLFADIVDYTNYSSNKPPAIVVSKLDDIFHRFDELADKHGLEKIKTIGDAYLVVGGLPEPHPNHERAMAEMAIDMIEAVSFVEADAGRPFTVRIGIHCGPVVAGVIGRRKFAYDLWGDTVNVASRLESNGVPGRIQVSESFANYVGAHFRFESRGRITMKGKGELSVFFLLGKADEAGNAAQSS